jgi:RNA-binding protein
MDLSGKDRRFLRSLGNALKPVVWVGREGLTPGILRSIDEAHSGSELIKIKILEASAAERKSFVSELGEATASAVVGMVGGTILLYRPDPESPRITLPSSRD